MDYNEALSYIHSVSWRGSRPGLSRTRELLARLGDPQKLLRFVHVAGTNGKGSTAAMLESVLRAAGYKTGLFTSPFITRFNERIRVNGRDIPDASLAELTERVRLHADAMDDAPTEFELITAIGMLFFAEEKCDIVVLETGLGGELDSTNVIDAPTLAVITAIALDHTEVLGPTLTDVARAKAGIIKEGSAVVSYGGAAEADAVIEKTCREKNVPLITLDFSLIARKAASLTGIIFDYGAMKDVFVPFAGLYQMKNAALVITAARALSERGFTVTETDIRVGLASVEWKGRLELLRRAPLFLLDGSHNPHGISATAETLTALFPQGGIVFLTGVMADKDIGHMIEGLASIAGAFVTVTPENSRALPAQAYAERLRAAGFRAEAAADIDEGVSKAMILAGENGVVCAIGSLYMSADVRDAVGRV